MQTKFAILSILLYAALPSVAQEAVATWESQTIRSERTGEQRAYVSTFKIYTNRVDWIQGSMVQTFPITSTEGTLPEERSGQVIYYLLKEGRTGKLIVERSNINDTVLILDLSEGGESGAFYSFRVANP